MSGELNGGHRDSSDFSAIGEGWLRPVPGLLGRMAWLARSTPPKTQIMPRAGSITGSILIGSTKTHHLIRYDTCSLQVKGSYLMVSVGKNVNEGNRFWVPESFDDLALH